MSGDVQERSIRFRDDMVCAILDGRKTQTRQVMNPQPTGPYRGWGCIAGQGFGFIFGGDVVKPRIGVGNRLWVQECWADSSEVGDDDPWIVYRATDPDWGSYEGRRWRPAANMPRWASRITLVVESVIAQRVQNISEQDAVSEGARYCMPPTDQWGRPLDGWSLLDPHPINAYGAEDGWRHCLGTARLAFANYWNSINAKRGYGWDANPWAVTISFRRLAGDVT
jgi:hypothetical protein